MVQLVVCGAIFVTMVAVKLLLPAKMAQFGSSLSEVMNQNMDMTAVFSAVGRAVSGEEDVQNTLSDVYQAVFHPEDAGAVETAAPVDPEYGEPNPLCSMRDFARGTGSCDSWLSLRTSAPAADTGQAAAVDSETTSAEPAKTAKTAQTPQDSADTMQLSYTLYSSDNLPDNVSLEQEILGFDYCTPVCGVLSSGFGYREHPIEGEEKFHYGIDIAADEGTEIDCFADGTVTAVGESNSYGKYLMISHRNGYSTLYAHCSAIKVSSGETVKEGQKIAEVGETGLATGPHLHFELHDKSTYLDPIYYVSLV
jgi:cold shock CspA family protein